MATMFTRFRRKAEKMTVRNARNLSIGYGGPGGIGGFNPFGPPIGGLPPGGFQPPPGGRSPWASWVPPGTRTSPTQGLGPIGIAACDFLKDDRLKALCIATVGSITGGSGPTPPGPIPGRPGAPPLTAPPSCPPGKVLVAGRCVDPTAALPGGQPFISPGPSQAVQGAFGLPALVPSYEERIHRDCPAGMVLGKDDLCYPKAVIGRRSKFRKWRQPRKPLFTAGDLNAIRRANRLQDRARRIGKDLGLKVSKR